MLSDTEPVTEDTTQSNIEIVEVSEPTGDFLEIFSNSHTYKNMHITANNSRSTNMLLELSKNSRIRLR